MWLNARYVAMAGFLAGRGASRRVIFGRGVAMVLTPVAVMCVLAIIYNGRALLFNVARDFTYGTVPRWKDVLDDLVMMGCGGFALFCEIAGLNFFRMVEKKFDLITLLAFVAGLFNVLLILMFGTLGLVGLVDLIWPGARIGS
jgi:hypothetical protein